jgi:hypothetical protein
LEYDLHINPTKLIKGKGLAKLLSESNCKVLELHQIFTQSDAPIIQPGQDNLQVFENYSSSPWYKNIIYFLQHFECPPDVKKTKARSLKLKAIKFCISNQSLYWRDPAGILLKCLDENEAKQVTTEMHRGVCGGHQHWKATTLKILRAGYYWPTLFSDVFSTVRACNECQIFAGKQKLLSLPLKPITASGPFQKWGLDFIGEINPPSSGQHKWILTATDYFTKWIEVVPTRNATDKVIMNFLETNIFSRFGCPSKLVTDNAQAFKSKAMIDLCGSHNISLTHSTPYYPQGNGLAESSNKTLIRIIKKLLTENKKSWDSKLKYALWADRINTKKSLGTSPFQLVYGIDIVFPTQLGIPVLKFLQEEIEEPNDIQRRIFQIIEVQQRREALDQRTEAYQNKIKSIFDKKTKKEIFQKGDLVLRWDARRDDKSKHGKFDNLWFGPFKVVEVLDNNTFILHNLDDTEIFGGPVNGRFLKHYFV